MKNNNSSIFSRMFSSLSLLQKVFLLLSVGVFILSLFFHAYTLEGNINHDDSKGIKLLSLGWMGIFIGYLVSFIWAANPLYFLSLYYFIKGSRFAMMFSLPAFILGILFSRINEIIINENGKSVKIESFDIGYYCWVASFLLLFVGSKVEIITPKKIQN